VTIEIDEQRRELRGGGRVAALQPKVFDLLAYLARHRHRVVSKRELLETIWPDVIVTDASLQRAISLARAALADLGAADAIRTHARHGYSFRPDAADVVASDTVVSSPEETVEQPEPTPLLRAREAYARGEWAEAIALLHTVDDVDGLAAEDLRRWAHAAQCLGRPAEALSALERAVAASAARGDQRRAAWAAILAAHLRLEWGEGAIANGWIQRAAHLLVGVGACREQGYVDVLRSRLALFGNQLDQALSHALLAREAGQTFADPDLESLALMQAGQAWLFTGSIHEGLNALDEAAVAVAASDLSAWAGGLVYCGVIYSYMTRADWQRAGQWTEQFTRWCEGRGVAAYPGLCRMHRAQVLCVQGQLPEALREMQATLDMLEQCAPWARGTAWSALGDILLARGSLGDARAAYVRAIELGYDSTFGLARVRFAEGDVTGALRQLTRGLDDHGYSFRSQRGVTLAHIALMATAAGELQHAQSALDELDRQPELVATPALGALAARARGELLAAQGDRAAAIRQLRNASRLCQTQRAPLACAEIHRALARVLLAEDLEAAEIELGAATTLFRQAGANGQLATCEPLHQQIERARQVTASD
jgi:DNA-binding winged helix-turn-helix (wHTH) protein/predicted negative regulator of RcsB-dependent stress response